LRADAGISRGWKARKWITRLPAGACRLWPLL